MHLPETFNAPRLCYLASRPFWVRALGLEDWATILAWLDDILPGRSEREEPPLLSDEASRAMIHSDLGCALLAWLALRHDDVTYEAAADFWGSASDEERRRLMEVLLHRRRSLEHSNTPGTDLGETWCAKGMAELALEIGMTEMGRLSLDQLEWLSSNGKCDGEIAPSVRGQEEAIEAARKLMEQFGLNGKTVEAI